jgi:RNA polymerase primary sigma factor
LEQLFEREPSADEIAMYLEMDVQEVIATMSSATKHISMDQPFANNEESSLLDILENPNSESSDSFMVFNSSLQTEINRSLSTLTERQKDVIRFFYGIGVDHALSLEDIGEKFNLTRERVRQIKDKAITRLQAVSRCKLLRSYLGA